MVISRIDSAAATRTALLDAAAALLDEGGPDAVTLREVGARAGVSRGAPYGHFPDKEHLLVQLAVDGWREVVDRLRRLRADTTRTPAERLDATLLALVDLGRTRPHLAALMFAPLSGATDDLEAVGGEAHREFLPIVADVVGDADARRTGALLMSAANGAVALERSGHLGHDKWGVTAEELVHALVATLGAGGR